MTQPTSVLVRLSPDLLATLDALVADDVTNRSAVLKSLIVAEGKRRQLGMFAPDYAQKQKLKKVERWPLPCFMEDYVMYPDPADAHKIPIYSGLLATLIKARKQAGDTDDVLKARFGVSPERYLNKHSSECVPADEYIEKLTAIKAAGEPFPAYIPV